MSKTTDPTDAEKIAAFEKQISELTAAIGESRRALALMNAQCQAFANQRNAFANEAASLFAQLSVAQPHS